MTPTPNSWLPQPLRALAGRALAGALNHVITLDPDTRQALGALDGRSVLLRLRGPELALAVTVAGGALTVGPPDVPGALHVTTTPGTLLNMLLRPERDGLTPGAVEISGDAELARRLERLARDFAPDFEEAFTRVFGDVGGVPIARAVRDGLAHVRAGAAHFGADAADWLRDEAQLAPPAFEVDAWMDGVDALRERAERLGARVARLAGRASGRPA